MLNSGKHFRLAVAEEHPLQIAGTINAISALLAKKAGFKAIYLSGAGVANASFGLPDLGITTLNDVVTDASRITSATDLPLLVDIDTGFGGAFNIARTIKQMMGAGVAAVHIEDQVASKRCGHRPGKQLVKKEEMVDRIKAAVDARTQPDFVIMARSDALATEGLDACIERFQSYVEAGADMLFFEGVKKLEQYAALAKHCKVPILANITEFGVTPLFTTKELHSVNVDMVLYPLSAFRIQNRATLAAYQTIRSEGSQKNLIDKMQTREELYELLNYHSYEAKLDELFAKGEIHE